MIHFLLRWWSWLELSKISRLTVHSLDKDKSSMAPLSTYVLNTLLNSSLSLSELQCLIQINLLSNSPCWQRIVKHCTWIYVVKIVWHSLLWITHYTVHVQLKHNTQSLRHRAQIRNVQEYYWGKLHVFHCIAINIHILQYSRELVDIRWWNGKLLYIRGNSR